MSSTRPLRLELSPSRRLAAAVLGVHAAAAGSVLAVAPGSAGLAIAVLLVALGAAAAWDRALLRGRRAPRAVEISAQGKAVVVLADGRAVAATAAHGMGTTRHWVALATDAPLRRSVLVTAGHAAAGPVPPAAAVGPLGQGPGRGVRTTSGMTAGLPVRRTICNPYSLWHIGSAGGGPGERV